MALRTRVARFDELTDDDVRAWRDLAGRTAEPNVFFEPELLLPAVRHLAAPGAVRLAVVVDEDGRWQACAPVKREAAWGRLRLPCLTMWTHEFSGLEVPLIDEESPGPALRSLLGILRRPISGVFAAFTQLPADGVVRRSLEELTGGAAIEVARYERAALARRPAFTYLDDMSGKRRHDLARRRRRLAELHGDVAVVDMSADPAALETFLTLEASGWKGREGTALLSDPAHAAFFREACTALRDAGRLHLIALVADGRPIAMKCNGLAGRRLFGFKQAFDEELSAVSPGRLLDIDQMRVLHDRDDVDLLDTIGSAENDTLNVTWPDRLTMTTVLVPSRGPLGWIAGKVLRRLLCGGAPASSVAVPDAPLAAGVAGR